MSVKHEIPRLQRSSSSVPGSEVDSAKYNADPARRLPPIYLRDNARMLEVRGEGPFAIHRYPGKAGTRAREI